MPSEKFSEIMKPIFSNELHFNHLNGTVSLRKTDTDKGTQTELSMNKVLCPRCEDRDNLGKRFNSRSQTILRNCHFKLTNQEVRFNRSKESVMLGMESRIMNLIEKLLKKRKRNPFPQMDTNCQKTFTARKFIRANKQKIAQLSRLD